VADREGRECALLIGCSLGRRGRQFFLVCRLPVCVCVCGVGVGVVVCCTARRAAVPGSEPGRDPSRSSVPCHRREGTRLLMHPRPAPTGNIKDGCSRCFLRAVNTQRSQLIALWSRDAFFYAHLLFVSGCRLLLSPLRQTHHMT